MQEMFLKEYGEVFQGDEHWQKLPVPEGDLFAWDPASTYVKHPPYFVAMQAQPAPVKETARHDHTRRPPRRPRYSASSVPPWPGPAGRLG